MIKWMERGLFRVTTSWQPNQTFQFKAPILVIACAITAVCSWKDSLRHTCVET
ncbi:hypothetical protein BYT27DRAFT_7199673 [Phlegmacium glaucopus]|nr:hypothetical protein BYT27DRAFT_7199673 [Phlegmacium glaucopus]